MRFPSLLRRMILAVLVILLVVVALDRIFALPQEKLNPPSSTLLLDMDGNLLRAFLAPDEMWRLRVESDEISPLLKKATLAYEDRHFRYHPGVNPISIARAAVANIRAGKVVQGGSTITMQVARLIEPKERTVAGKLIEVWRALQLEAHYSKDEILTCYFNLAPYGGNLVGVGAASRVYFNKPPDKLSPGEAALLAAIPNSPNRNRPDVATSLATQSRDKVLKLMRRRGVIDDDVLAQATKEPVPERRFDLPFEAPHLAEYLRSRYQRSERIESTIDRSLQNLAEMKLKEQLKPLSGRGISNGAVVVIDNRNQAVRALVGSQEFFESASNGQVNGAMALRSPGSALKPFVYTLAIGNGLVSPRSLLFDVPVDYSGYRPVNYDEQFNGAVTVEDALIRSLNVPAVNMTAKLGGETFYEALKQGGINSLNKSWAKYGLPLALGGCEVSLLELTNLYATLANGGRYRPYRLLDTEDEPEGKAIFDESAAFIVTEILSQLRRPELPTVWDAAVNMPKVAWKTGTSLGKRDAWSIGYTPTYTVGVWVGNFNGKGNPSIVGAEVAAPILFSMFEALAVQDEPRWFLQPSSVGTRQVCAVSGMPATERCAATVDEMFIEGISPNLSCTMHELIYVNGATGERLCNHCRNGHKIAERVITQWPTQIATWMERNGFAVERIPEHNVQCALIRTGDSPVIISPADKSQYRVRDGVKLEYQKILLDASVSNDTHTIYWFLNRKLIYSGDPSERFFITPTRGAHTLICMDDAGRSSQVTMTVED